MIIGTAGGIGAVAEGGADAVVGEDVMNAAGYVAAVAGLFSQQPS